MNDPQIDQYSVATEQMEREEAEEEEGLKHWIFPNTVTLKCPYCGSEFFNEAIGIFNFKKCPRCHKKIALGH